MLEPTLLQIIWFLLVTILLGVYFVLDGFDLGVGVLSLFVKDSHSKRILMNSIGPFWDGNEVWLIAGGGAIFAAFPVVYATAFSAFYLAVYLLLFALFFRAISLELRNKVDSRGWEKFWEISFGVGSLLSLVLLGVAFGNILRGLPLNDSKTFTGNFFELLNPYSILVGVFGLIMGLMHSAIYLATKTTGELEQKYQKLSNVFYIVFIISYLIITMISIFVSKYLFDGITHSPFFWVLFLLLLVSFVMIPVSLNSKNIKKAFTFSSISLFSIIGLAGVGMFPKLIPSVTNLNNSLTIMNTASTEKTLLTMLIIALIGMPFVVVYTIYIYKVFKGKTEIDKESY
ncbi:MAG TPA: cytochrome d ubiquinol oxidase subunit II [Ignavibacteria bacterium]|nr:cytochrome d ubiquinol oxidase subunit II [Ignavibacteria bacterium]